MKGFSGFIHELYMDASVLLPYIGGKSWVLTDLKNAWNEIGRYYITTFENKDGSVFGFSCKKIQYIFLALEEKQIPHVEVCKITIDKNSDAEGERIQKTIRKFMEQFDEEKSECFKMTEHKNDVQVLYYSSDDDLAFFKTKEKNDDLGVLFALDDDEEHLQRLENFFEECRKNEAFEKAWNKLSLNERAYCWANFELGDEEDFQKVLDALETENDVKEIFESLQLLAESHTVALYELNTNEDYEPTEYFEQAFFETQYENDEDSDEEDEDYDEENKIAADLLEYDSDDDVTIFYDYNSDIPTYQKKKPSEDFIKLLDKWEEILQREDAPILVFNPKDKIPKIYAAAEDAWTRQIIFKYKTPKNDATLRFEFGRVYHISDLYTKECFLKLSYEKGSRKMEGSVNMYYPNGGFRGEAEVKLNIVKLLTYIGRNELAELVVNLQARTDAERKRMEEEALHKKLEKEEREQEAFEDEFDDL